MSAGAIGFFIYGLPAIVLTGGVAGGYLAHRYSPTYLATGLGAVGGLVLTAVAIPYTAILISSANQAQATQSAGKTGAPSGSTL